MARRGRCRCGVILTFRRGPSGYKVRCPNCRSVVRLRVGPNPAVDEPLRKALAPTQLLDAAEAAGLDVPRPEAPPVTVQVVSAAAAALPSRIGPVLPPPPSEAAVVACPACGKALTPGTKRCPRCARRPPAPAAPALPAEEEAPWVALEAAPGSASPAKARWWLPLAIAAGVGTLTVAVGIGALVAVAWFRRW